jgi:FSR family fosmidomycin resistance protein-like MFS transporter
MAATTESTIQPAESAEFQTAQIAPVVGAHLVHDIYTSAIAPLLPVLIEKLSLNLTQAGLLTTFIQFPGVLNPFIGYLADKVSLRYFVILAPAVTATLIGMIGFAPNYFALAILLFAAGVSTACFHATAPAMIGRVSGRKIGLGMSMFMAAGEAAYAVGPLLAVWVVSTWTLEGFWRIAVLGWAATLLLYLRMRGVSARVEKPGSLHEILPALTSLYLPFALFNLVRFPLSESLTTYLPTLMIMRGASLFVAGASLSILMVAGVVGVMLIGPLSDRIGRKVVLIIVTLASAGLALLFLQVSGWQALLVLMALGFFALSTNAIMMAIVQERFPSNRAMANGLYMMLNFVLRPAGTVAVGFMGDQFGLEKAMFWGALVSLLGVIPILKLPKKIDRI